MVRSSALIFGLLAAPAFAQSLPAKLVIIAPNQQPTIAPYASMSRCELARSSLNRQIAFQAAQAKAALPPGYRIVVPAPTPKVYCIPG